MPHDAHAPPRVLLIGWGPTAASALDSLAEHVPVVGVVRPPCPTGDPTVARAGALGVPVLTEMSVPALGRHVDRLEPDVVVVSSYNRVLPEWLVARARFVNVHYALLPRYRGRANVNWAVINGEPSTGVTIHVLDPALDAGHILFQQEVPLGPADTVGAVYDTLNRIQQAHLGSVVLDHWRGAAGQPQDERAATYGCTRLPRDGEIDWAGPTAGICALVRALSRPYPGAFTYLERTRLWVWRAEPAPDHHRYAGRIPGRVVRVSPGDGWVDVLSGDGVVRIHQVESAAGPRGPAADVITSVKCTLGIHLPDLLDRLAVLELAVARMGGDGFDPCTPRKTGRHA